MTQLPLPDAIDRFKENEERIDTFVNGDENASYEPIGGGDDVPSVQKFLADKDAEIKIRFVQFFHVKLPTAKYKHIIAIQQKNRIGPILSKYQELVGSGI